MPGLAVSGPTPAPTGTNGSAPRCGCLLQVDTAALNPFHADGSCNEAALRSNARRWVDDPDIQACLPRASRANSGQCRL